MNNDAFTLVKRSMASKKSSTSEELVSYRVTPETELQPLEFLFRMNGTECFPLSELVANTGKAKSGKTLFLSIVMACCLKKNVLGLERIRDNPIRVLWYDTEQSAQSTQQILCKRIIPLAHTETADTSSITPLPSDINDSFYVFNVRGIGWEKRRELLAAAIYEFKPNLVIVDGIKDLITDINDGTQATMVVEDQMGLAQTYNCCIVDVLHQNKSDTDRNMRGWIGTELTNKAFEVWSCAIVPNTATFKVEQVMSRMKRCDKNLYYQLDDNAIPVSCEAPDEQPREPNGRYASKKKPEDAKSAKPKYKIDWATLNRDYILPNDAEVPLPPEQIPWNLEKLFSDAMEGYDFKRFNQLMAIVMRISHIEDNKYYYHLLEQAQTEHIIAACKDALGQQGFVLNSPEVRKRILAYEEEQRRNDQEPEQAILPCLESEDDKEPPC